MHVCVCACVHVATRDNVSKGCDRICMYTNQPCQGRENLSPRCTQTMVRRTHNPIHLYIGTSGILHLLICALFVPVLH